MQWADIKNKYPDKFILIGNIVEEKIDDSKYKILEGKILKVTDNPKEIMNSYQDYKDKGIEVLYSIPSTPENFIVENVPIVGILK